MIPARLTYARAIQLRAELQREITSLRARRKGVTAQERDLKTVTTWIVRYETRHADKIGRAA